MGTAAPGRELLLEHVSEADWTRQVLTWARRGGWCGWRPHKRPRV